MVNNIRPIADRESCYFFFLSYRDDTANVLAIGARVRLSTGVQSLGGQIIHGTNSLGASTEYYTDGILIHCDGGC